MFEYQINTPFLPLTFSYSQDVPQIYRDIRDDKNISAIAEYPIDRIGIEYDSIVYYLTMQTVHGKKIFNSTSPTDTRATIHIAMKDITDPQTLPALRSMGIKYIVIHGASPEEIMSKTKNLQVVEENNPPIFGLTMIRPGKSNQIVLTKIIEGPELGTVLVIDKGFAVNLPLQQSPLDTQFEVVQDAELKLAPVDNKNDNSTMAVCFDAKMSAPQDTADLIISINGRQVGSYPISGTYASIRLDAKRGESIRLHTLTGHNMRLDNLGCQQ